jgi:hypothetical protein
MASDLQGATGLEHDLTAEAKMAKLRELFADAPEVGKTAAEVARLPVQTSSRPRSPTAASCPEYARRAHNCTANA